MKNMANKFKLKCKVPKENGPTNEAQRRPKPYGRRKSFVDIANCPGVAKIRVALQFESPAKKTNDDQNESKGKEPVLKISQEELTKLQDMFNSMVFACEEKKEKVNQ